MTEQLIFSQPELQQLSKMLCLNSDEVLKNLNLSLRKDAKKYSGCCPVHDGDNITALNLFYDGLVNPGYWRCYTQKCEKIFQPTIIGFIRGVLSRQNANWTKRGDNTVSFEDTLKWCLNSLGIKKNEIVVDKNMMAKARFIALADAITPKVKEVKNKWTKDEYLSRIGSQDYFLGRGFSKEVLDKYEVGLSLNTDSWHPACNRVLTPVYDDVGKFVVGVQGRSLYEQCKECKTYHSPAMQCPTALAKYSKWANMPDNFEISQHLYNFWHSKKHIQKTKKVIIVEGPPNIWRLEEAGCEIGVALCGSSMSDPQQILLETVGISHIYLLLDNDIAGQACVNDIYNKMYRQCKITNIQIPAEYNDLAELSVDQVQRLLGEYNLL